MKRIPFLLAALMAIATCSSCIHPELEGGVTIRFSTCGMQSTKAVTPGDGTVADGGGIKLFGTGTEGDPYRPDLVILLAQDNAAGNIVAKYSWLHPADGTLKDCSATEATIEFATVPPGDYIVYAFANTTGLDGDGNLLRINGQGASQTAEDFLLGMGTSSTVEALTFQPISQPLTPDDVTCMPLSAKGSLNVTVNGNGEVSLELLRCMAKITAEFINNTDETLVLTDYSNSFHGLCPDIGYVIKHPAISPSSAVSHDLEASERTLTIPDEGSISNYWYVFPSAGPYTCDISFTYAATNHVYTGLPVTNSRREDIMSLLRNQHLHIVTRISRGDKVSFNFEVAGWEAKTETVEFE